MAIGALQVSAVILRFVGQTRVAIICRRPGIWAMTQSAIVRCIEVSRIHTRRGSAVMAGRTGSQNLIVIDGDDWSPYIGAVAILTDVCRLWVQWPLTCRIGAVVAVHTIAHNIGVIEVRWKPGNRCVAVIAVVTAGDMCRVLAGRSRAIVARSTGANHLCVVHRKGGYPGVRCMTVFANLAGLNVRQVLSRGIRAVVATGTIASDVHVIEVRGQPADG